MKYYFLVFLILASGCAPSDLPKYTAIQGLRVLTLHVDAPEINFDGATLTPGTVNITPSVSDLYGSGRSLAFNLEWCLDPGISVGAVPTCAGNPSRTVVSQAQAVALTATFLSPNFTGNLNSFAVDLTASATATALMSAKFLASNSIQQFNGVAVVIIFEIFVINEPTTKVTSFKRVLLTSPAKVTKNQNPSGLEIRQSSVEITSLPSIDSEMTAFLPSTQAESYSALGSTGVLQTKTETLDTTWFLTGPADVKCSNTKDCTTDGLFKLSRTNQSETNLYYAPKVDLPTSRGRVLIAVTRDNRGGNVVKRYCFGSCP